jgi:hypothetical protein
MPVASAASASSFSSIGFMPASAARRDTGNNSTGVRGSSFLRPMHRVARFLQNPHVPRAKHRTGGAAIAASAEAPAHPRSASK